MKEIITIATIYLLSAASMWRYLNIAYSKNGICYGDDPDGGDVFLVFCPLLNTLFSIGLWIKAYPNANKKLLNLNKFFRIN